MDGLGVSGSSYPMVHRYLKGSAEPSLSFLRHAADILHVRYEWLAVGQGGMTEDEEAVRHAPKKGASEKQTTGERIWGGIEDSFPSITRAWRGGWSLKELYPPLYGRLLRTAKNENVPLSASQDEALTRSIGGRLGKAAQAPLDALGIDATVLSEWQLNMYLSLLSRALMIVMVQDYELMGVTTREDVDA